MKRRVTVEIDLGALVRNYRRMAEHAKPAQVLCVLKANAYGLGVAGYARALAGAGCRAFGVAEPYEALELVRVFKNTAEPPSVQILSSVLPDEIAAMVKAGVVLPVTGLESAKLISAAALKARRKAEVHLKIDTGMGRLGIPAKDALGEIVEIGVALLEILRLNRIACNLDYQLIHSAELFGLQLSAKEMVSKRAYELFRKLCFDIFLKKSGKSAAKRECGGHIREDCLVFLDVFF